MATLLEQTRATHEELEKYERVIALDLAQDTKSHRERLAQSHRVNNTLLQISDRASKLVRPSPVCGTVHDRQPDCLYRGCCGAVMPAASWPDTDTAHAAVYQLRLRRVPEVADERKTLDQAVPG
jgi:hypothetical protein